MDDASRELEARHDDRDETIAALRRELAAEREISARQAQELRACQEEKDEAERVHHRELAARTEERDAARLERDGRTEELRLARNYMGGLLGYIENDLERVDSALELLGCADRDTLLDEAQAFVCAP